MLSSTATHSRAIQAADTADITDTEDTADTETDIPTDISKKAIKFILSQKRKTQKQNKTMRPKNLWLLRRITMWDYFIDKYIFL